MSIDSFSSRTACWALAIVVLGTLSSGQAFAQCAFTTAFGNQPIVAGPPAQFSTCSFAGEYSVATGAVNGQTLRFDSSIGTDYITIRSGTSNGPVLGFGPTPLFILNNFNGPLFAHWSANSSCAAQSTCRITTVQIPAQCSNSSSFGSATVDPGGNVSTISTCSFAGEYSVIGSALNGQLLRVASSNPTDYITIHSTTFDGPVIAAGLTPLIFLNTHNGSLFAHWNADATCAAQSACRTGTVQVTNSPMFFNGFE